MKCLILAAGRGSRLQHKKPKPLIPLLGIPLIERVIRTAKDSGVDEFFVVVGYKKEEISIFLKQLSIKLNIPITVIENEQWNSKENGYSVLKAKDFIHEPFLLMMSDHIVDKKIIKKVLDTPLNEDVVLGVDIRVLNNPFVDLDDVTRVKFSGNKILNIGKKIKDYNGFDTGVFKCHPVIFEALLEASKIGKTTLSEAIMILSKLNKARICAIDDGFWVDVDTKKAFKLAEKQLIKQLGKQTDGIISRYINRPISKFISRRLANTSITPNAISLISFILSIIAAFLIAQKSYAYLLAGGVLAQLASIIDGCDGEIARLKYLSSTFGGWFDAVLDRYADGFLLFAMMIHSFCLQSLYSGFAAIMGSFMVSYTADKYDALIKKNLTTFPIRIGRDLRVFLIFLGSALNLTTATLALLAAIMNLEVVRRIIVFKSQQKKT